MPGLLGRVQPLRQLTTPACSQVPLTLQTRGPPESPWGGEGSAVAGEAGEAGDSGEDRAHLAGVLFPVPGTHHVVMDDLDVVPRVQASVVLRVTQAVFHDGDLHLLQRVWRWQGF